MQGDDMMALTLAEAADRVRTTEISPAELADAYLDRIERLEPAINAYITVTAGRARVDARQAADEIVAGNYRGPLHGIPIACKDLVDTAEVRTTAGSKVADNIPARDATFARKLAEVGAVNPEIMHGAPVFPGARVPIEALFGCLASGEGSSRGSRRSHARPRSAPCPRRWKPCWSGMARILLDE